VEDALGVPYSKVFENHDFVNVQSRTYWTLIVHNNQIGAGHQFIV
jgi:hypothetical protein